MFTGGFWYGWYGQPPLASWWGGARSRERSWRVEILAPAAMVARTATDCVACFWSSEKLVSSSDKALKICSPNWSRSIDLFCPVPFQCRAHRRLVRLRIGWASIWPAVRLILRSTDNVSIMLVLVSVEQQFSKQRAIKPCRTLIKKSG